MAEKKNSKAKKADYDPNAPHEAGMKIDVKDGNDHQMSKDFTVERITAATMVTLACNTVAQALNTEEGTPSRNATVRMCNKTFGDMRKSAETCRKAGDDFVADVLGRGIAAYEDYIAKHEASESMKAGEPGRANAIRDASDAMEHLADVMNDLLRAF